MDAESAHREMFDRKGHCINMLSGKPEAVKKRTTTQSLCSLKVFSRSVLLYKVY